MGPFPFYSFLGYRSESIIWHIKTALQLGLQLILDIFKKPLHVYVLQL